VKHGHDLDVDLRRSKTTQSSKDKYCRLEKRVWVHGMEFQRGLVWVQIEGCDE